jgi:hypothetical protein
MAGGLLGVVSLGGWSLGGWASAWRRKTGRPWVGVGVEWVSSRHRGLSRAMALHVAKSVGRSLPFSEPAADNCQGPLHKGWERIFAEPPCGVAAFVVNSEPDTGARSSVRVCLGPELARCTIFFVRLGMPGSWVAMEF